MTSPQLCRLCAGLSAVLLFLTGCSAPQPNSSLQVTEPSPVGQALLHYPEDSLTVGVNPPGFTWTAHPAAAGYRFVLYRGGAAEEKCLTLEGLISTAAALDTPLASGEYSWSVDYRDSTGVYFGRSRLRRFKVEEAAPQLALPEVKSLRERLSAVRPRLFLTAAEFSRIKAAVEAGRAPFWPLCRSLADSALAEPLYPEPAPWKDGKFDVTEWRRIYTPAKVGSAHLVRLALAYRLTGEPKYLEGARRWLVHLARWDPNGITSYNLPLAGSEEGGDDEAGMPLLERLAIGFDWLAQELTPEEKAVVLASLKERGNQILERYKRNDFISNPWSNHDGRVLSFFGLAALSCLGELPEADEWLRYVLRCYLTSYPSWGGDEGGWAQGLSYWTAYLLYHTNFVDALRQVTGFDLYKKPFFRNNGYFAVYFHPPYAKRGGFGDNGDLAPGLTEKILVRKYAVSTGDPVLLWQSQNISVGGDVYSKLRSSSGKIDWKEWAMDDVIAVISAVPVGLEPRSPEGLPGSKLLGDIGWAALHSDLGNAQEDVWVLFKSSRYGSFSHSHADQNSFQLNAYGEPLLIDSGYYPWYGSPHHILWTRQTRAHNAILVNGRGQAVFSMEASGKIEYFRQAGRFTFVRAEAGKAYNVPLDEETVAAWKAHLREPLPGVEPEVRLARRTLAFSGSKERPWLAVHDYLETSGPASFDYLLHSLEEMEFSADSGMVRVRNGKARLAVYLIADDGLGFSQSHSFSVPPEERFEGAPDQWHFKARTVGERDRVRFLALFVPYREGAAAPAVERLDSGPVRGFSIGGEKVLSWWGEGETGSYGDFGGGKPARLFIELSGEGGIEKYVCE